MLNTFIPTSVYFNELYLAEYSNVFFCRSIQYCAHHVGVNVSASYCGIYNENCNIKE